MQKILIIFFKAKFINKDKAENINKFRNPILCTLKLSKTNRIFELSYKK